MQLAFFRWCPASFLDLRALLPWVNRLALLLRRLIVIILALLIFDQVLFLLLLLLLGPLLLLLHSVWRHLVFFLALLNDLDFLSLGLKFLDEAVHRVLHNVALFGGLHRALHGGNGHSHLGSGGARSLELGE